jgi:hypothetical protein
MAGIVPLARLAAKPRLEDTRHVREGVARLDPDRYRRQAEPIRGSTLRDSVMPPIPLVSATQAPLRSMAEAIWASMGARSGSELPVESSSYQGDRRLGMLHRRPEPGASSVTTGAARPSRCGLDPCPVVERARAWCALGEDAVSGSAGQRVSGSSFRSQCVGPMPHGCGRR